LSLAAANNLPDMVKLILAHKPKVDILDKDGLTPLQRAVAQQQVDIAGMLLEAGANPNVKFQNEGGMNLLEKAAGSRNKSMVEVLLAHRADPNQQNNDGDTALSLANKWGTNPELRQVMGEIAELLRSAGANDNLQRLSTICVSRAGADYTQIVFHKEAGVPNRYSLLDLVAAFYAPPDQATPYTTPLQELPGLAFPDFGKIKIFRLQKDGRTNAIREDLNQQFDSGDCSKDVALEWGDVVEIPEADHNINEKWTGLSDQAMATLRNCLASQVVIMVKGKTNLVTLKPLLYRRNPSSNPGFGPGGFGSSGTIYYGERMVGPRGFEPANLRAIPKDQPSFWLYDVVHGANVILTSSDLSRVKVTRKDLATRKTVEMTIDLQKSDPANALWLRDRDVIELPEKP
jgi:hypothetical protein